MSKKDYGCFFCKGKSIDYDSSCPDCSKPINIERYLDTCTFGEYKPTPIPHANTAVLGRGFYGWTLHVRDQYQSFAMKVVPKHRLKTKNLGEQEIRSLIACSPHRNITRFIRPVEATVLILGENIDVYCMVFEYVPNSRPLASLISTNDRPITKTDVVGILAGIASGLERMHSNNLWHDDLHDDNILIRNVSPDENLPERFEAKIIDFGSTRAMVSGQPESVDHCDYFYLSKHIYNVVLMFEVSNKGKLTPFDRAFASRLRRLAHQLADKDTSRRSLTPTATYREIKAAFEEGATGYNYPSFTEMRERLKISFSEPLANANALNLEPQDIALLFRDSLKWQDRLSKSEAVLVVGPRGCGKTMLLRYLSIASNARPQEKEATPAVVGSRLMKMPYLGFLINVAQLRTPFFRSSFKTLEDNNTRLAEDFCREYFNCHFAYEVIRTFIWLNEQQIIAHSRDDLDAVNATLNELLNSNTASKCSTIESIAEVLDNRVMELSNLASPDSYKPSNMCRDDVLERLARAIKNTSLGKGKEIWFLLDDYSITVIPPIAQLAYNPVLFRLSSDVRVKISSEGEGPLLTDTMDRKYREGREITKVNLGEVYFQADERDGREFFENILEARFRETKKGSLTELFEYLGEHEHENSFGEYILSKSRAGTARFYGFGLLCRLCSGDVSFILELLHKLTKGSWDNIKTKPTPADQDEIIKKFAQTQLAELHSTAKYGEKLYTFAQGMGQLIKHYLLESKSRDPDERLRIEIEDWEEFDPEAKTMHEALMRYSVLISGGAGKSQKGLPTKKFYFRRLFAPCFPFSPARKGSIAITFTEYQKWLLKPETIGKRPSGKKLPKKKRNATGQSTLFPDERAS